MNVYSFIVDLLTLAGMASVVDVLMDRKLKVLVSNYIFGVEKICAGIFEYSLAKIFIGLFISNKKVKFLRVLTVSLALTPPIFAILFQDQLFRSMDYISILISRYFDVNIERESSILWIITFFIVGVSTAPLDYVNVAVGKAIYFGELKFRRAFVRLFLDVTLSLGSVVFILWFVHIGLQTFVEFFYPGYEPSQQYTTYWWSSTPYIIETSEFGLFLAAIISSAVYLLARFVTLLSATLVRSARIIFGANLYVAMYSSAHEAPLTYLTVVAFLIWSIISLAIP